MALWFYQTGLALLEPQVQVQATSVLNLTSPATLVLRCRVRVPLRFQCSHTESSKESAEPDLTSSDDPELNHYGK